ncbi:MAG: hypothetical protein HGJ97_14705, partial [Desulfosporosinus sp.]|nr:hypothetical protein [Desulfosporosinus sp.]
MQGLSIGNASVAMINRYTETREICLVPYHVTFASLNKVKFCREFKMEENHDIIPVLEKEAQLTISKLKATWLFRNGIIVNITSDLNPAERIIYFELILAPETTQTSFIELLE